MRNSLRSSALLAATFVALFLDPLANASRLTPPILPLIVRNPYLSTWLQDAREAPWSSWPMFWTGEEIGFSVLAAVPSTGNVYPLLGKPHDSLLPARPDDGFNVSFPIYLGSQYDASTTNLTYTVPALSTINSSAGLDITLSFFSPITPTSTLRQAIPASYLTVHVRGHANVNIYIDVNGQWVSGDRQSKIEWGFQQQAYDGEKGLKTFTVKRETEQLLTEINDRSEWGTLYFTGPTDASHEVGSSFSTRQRFSKTFTLQNKVNTEYRGIMDEEPVFAFSKSFILNGTSESSESALFTIGHIQDPVVQFAAARGLTFMRPLWSSYFASAVELLQFHYLDFRHSRKLASDYSRQLSRDSYSSGAEDYRDIVALSARQVIGATSFSGTPENPILFLKEISSNGNFQTIDVIFPSFPFFLYTNPRWLAYILEPLIEHMLSGQYPNDYAMHDLGSHFPNATGHPDGNDEYMPVEECGDILIMGLALVNSLLQDEGSVSGQVTARSQSGIVESSSTVSLFALGHTGTTEGMKFIDERWGGPKGAKQAQRWVEKSYSLWKQWTGYLVEYALEPANQLSTDDFAGWLALQTNLALKGIIGIKAMSAIATAADRTEDAKHYERIARDYISKWETFGISRDGTHAKLAYDWYGSWTTIYNLFADSLLCFHLEDNSTSSAASWPLLESQGSQKTLKPNPGQSSKSTGFVPRHIYKIQSDWYHVVRQKYGLPLDNRHLLTKSDWEFFATAVTSKKVRYEILESVAKWVNETVTDRPFTDLYNTEGDGGFPGPNFFARPVIGGHFAFLTLERACDGKAMEGLSFLDEESSSEERLAELRVVAQDIAAMEGKRQRGMGYGEL